MGIYSDNFYSWLNRQNAVEKAAMDAIWSESEHPRGNPENSGQFKKKPETVDKVDDLKSPPKTKEQKEYEKLLKKKDAKAAKNRFERVLPKDLPTFDSSKTKSIWRKKRNEAYETLKKRREAGEKIDGSYDFDHLSEPVFFIDDKGIKRSGFRDGYMVSFQTTNGEGFRRDVKDLMVSDDRYDELVERLSKETGSKPYLGVFLGVPEISFKCKSFEQAMSLAQEFNQVSIANNAAIQEAERTHNWNDSDKDERDKIFPRNYNYDWTRNQIKKLKKPQEGEDK